MRSDGHFPECCLNTITRYVEIEDGYIVCIECGSVMKCTDTGWRRLHPLWAHIVRFVKAVWEMPW